MITRFQKTTRRVRKMAMEMAHDEIVKTARDSLVEALEEQSIGKPDNPVLPLVGSENVPISKEEEKDVE